jgi:hypothetical protein
MQDVLPAMHCEGKFDRASQGYVQDRERPEQAYLRLKTIFESSGKNGALVVTHELEIAEA